MTELWGVGCYDTSHTREPWEISQAEMHRDMGSAVEVLSELGVGAGKRVLFCSMLSEAGQFWPLIVGSMLAGAQLSCADATESDAARVAMFTRLLDYSAVLGVNEAVLDGLDALGHTYGDVFGGVAVLGARPGAHQRLQAAGLAPSHFVLCGPALAIARESTGRAFVNASEWQLDNEAERVVVTALQPRATAFERTHTAVIGDVVDNGVVPA
ncbi:MAG: hypothetical protein ABWZ15_15250 [Acidimicrobiia bacterium]